MGNFLLNELGEVLLEIQSHLEFGADLCLEVHEKSQTGVLKSLGKNFDIDFIHQELIMPLKRCRYLFVVERNNQFYALKSRLAKVVFVE